MRSRALAAVVISFVAFSTVATAQETVTPPEAQVTPAQAAPQPEAPSSTTTVMPAAPSSPAQPSPTMAAPAQTAIQPKADALLLYKQGRDLEAAGKTAEAGAKYRESVAVCDRELAADPTRMDAYTVKCWSLFRLDRYREVVDIGAAGLKVKFDARIVEVMGEAYFYLNDDKNAVKYLQRYLDNVGEYGDRVPTAYFYMAESFVRQKKLDHADIAYSFAVYREPGMARWWYRYASVAEALGEYSRAYDLYAKALKLSPSMAEAVSAQSRVKARL
jgi:tetratricopeptide (TPR) repeat protein